jgi:hypothetical protein
VELIDIYDVFLETSEAALARLEYVVTAKILAPWKWIAPLIADFGSQVDAVPAPSKRLTQKLFTVTGTIGVGGVYKGNAQIDGSINSADGGGVVGGTIPNPAAAQLKPAAYSPRSESYL